MTRRNHIFKNIFTTQINPFEIGSQYRLIWTNLHINKVSDGEQDGAGAKDSRIIDRRIHVCGDPDTKDCNIDGCDQSGNYPFYSCGLLLLIHHDGNLVDDDLHQALDLDDPAK
jgi:hypothetical protein